MSDVKRALTMDDLFKLSHQRNKLDLNLVDLSNTDLTACTLDNASLTNTNLQGAMLDGVSIKNSDLTDANLSGASMKRCQIAETDLQRADLTFADLSDGSIYKSDARNADFDSVTMLRGRLIEVNFDDTEITEANFLGSKLHGSTFVNGSLYSCNLGYTELDADMTSTSFDGSDFTGAWFGASKITNAYFLNAKFDRTQFGFPFLLLYGISGLGYYINIFKDNIRIAEECHTIEEWEAITDSDLLQTSTQSMVDFWHSHKDFILHTAKGLNAFKNEAEAI